MSRLSVILAVVFTTLAVYWLFLSQPAGLPLPRQTVLVLGYGSALILHGCAAGHRRERLLEDGKVNHGFVTKLIILSMSLATLILGAVLPTLYLLAAFAVEGVVLSAPELDVRLPAGYSGSFIVGLAAFGGAVTAAYAIYGYLDHVNSG